MSETQKFQHIINGIREDLIFVEYLYWKLYSNLMNNPHLQSEFSYEKTAFEIKEWINDVFLDKIYEIDSKILKFLTDVAFTESGPSKVSTREMEKCVRDIVQEKRGLVHENTCSYLDKLKRAISDYRESINATMDDVRNSLYKTNWTNMKNISIEDYILPTKRRKYVSAREELQWVKQTVKDGKYEDVLNHLRTSIELAIKERFGFKRIFPMKQFLKDADEYGLPLPSYQMLFDYYDEGSLRLHSGRLNTPFECRKALDFVDDFIDSLELINVPQKEIDDFKNKSRVVE
jgi:hypothetical protein